MESVPSNVELLLETPAGQGSELYVDLNEFVDVYQQIGSPEKFGLCLDTCHVFSTGYTMHDALDYLNRLNGLSFGPTTSSPVSEKKTSMPD